MHFTLCVLILMLTSCTSFYNAFYTDPEKCLTEADQNNPFDVIIVPGYPSDSGNIHDFTAQRVVWAKYLLDHGYTNNIIFSGGAVYTPYVESIIMLEYAKQIGIDPNKMFAETKAKHTTENVYYSCLMADSLGFKRIAFATQPAQSSFMKPYRRKFKLDYGFLPVVSDSIQYFNFTFDENAAKKAFVLNFESIMDNESFFKRVNGTRGKAVKKDMKRRKKLKKELNKSEKKR